MGLENKVAFITGAGRGIGRYIGLALAQKGAKIAVTGRTKDRREQVVSEILKEGGEARPYNLNVSNEDEILEATRQVLEDWGQIDILVNSAGIIQYNTPVWKTTVEEWDRMMDINLRGTFLCCHAVVPHMIEKETGIVINIASSAARMADDDLGAYTASKWGVAGYTTSLAKSVRPHGIRVNGLNPGWVDTDMSRDFDPKGDPEWSTPEEIAQAALYLAAYAPRDMTGQFLDIFGS